MAYLGNQTPIAQRLELVAIQMPIAPAVPDGVGGYIETYGKVDERWAQVAPAHEGRRLERYFSAGAMASATHLVSMPFCDVVTTKTRIIRESGKRLDVLGYNSVQGYDVETVCACQEIVD